MRKNLVKLAALSLLLFCAGCSREEQPKITELTFFECKDGVEVLLDINGDGAEEKISTTEEGIFINGVLQEIDCEWEYSNIANAEGNKQQWESFWVVDADPSDKCCNLIFSVKNGPEDAELLAYYDNTLREISRMTTSAGNHAFSEAEYGEDGILTVHGVYVDFLGSPYGADIKYRVNKEMKLERVEDFTPTNEPYELILLEEIAMYSLPDLESECIMVKPQTIKGLGSQGDWAKFCLEDGVEVWLHVKRVSGQGYFLDNGKSVFEVFDGFSNAG